MVEQTKAETTKQRPNSNKCRAVEVMLDLILETGKMPAVEEVLERSGISRRSFFPFFTSEGARILDCDFGMNVAESQVFMERQILALVDIKLR